MSDNTGGPAFPYSALQPGGPHIYADNHGMTLRDYFAAKAMQVIMIPNPVTGQYAQASEFEACAVGAYKMADAMLKARQA